MSDKQPRPVIDMLLATMMRIVKEVKEMGETGKTLEVIENEARNMLYESLDQFSDRIK